MTARLLVCKTVRELRANRAQTLALTAVVALGVTAFIAAIGAYRDLATSEATTLRAAAPGRCLVPARADRSDVGGPGR